MITPNAVKGVKKWDHSDIAGRNVQWCSLSDKLVGSFFKQLTLRPHDFTFTLLGIYPIGMNLCSHKNLAMYIYRNLIYNSTKLETTHRYFIEWMIQLWSVPTVGLLVGNKRNELLICATPWMNLWRIILSERGQSPKVTYCVIPFVTFFLKWQNYWNGEQITGCQRLMRGVGAEGKWVRL